MPDRICRKLNNLKPSDLLVVADLDESLLNDQHILSEENRTAIKEFITAGGHFAVASARTEPPVRLLGIPTNVPSVLYNGSALYDLNSDTFLWTQPMDIKALELVKTLLFRFPGLGVEVITQRGTYVVNRNHVTDFHIQLEHLQPLDTDISPDVITEPWMKIMLDWEEEKLNVVLKWLDSESDADRISFTYGFSNTFLIEITSIKTNKGIALEKLSGFLNIPLSSVIAIGDNLNDLQMMQTAGIRVAPANARREILELADYISVDHDEYVMRDLLRFLV